MALSALIVAGPGPLRDGLHALVKTMPQIRAVIVVTDVHSAFKAEFAFHPGLVLLEGDVAGGEISLTVTRARARWPGARTIVLAGNVRQQQQAEAAGADVVLMEGFPASGLVSTIARLVAQPVA